MRLTRGQLESENCREARVGSPLRRSAGDGSRHSGGVATGQPLNVEASDALSPLVGPSSPPRPPSRVSHGRFQRFQRWERGPSCLLTRGSLGRWPTCRILGGIPHPASRIPPVPTSNWNYASQLTSSAAR